MADTLSDNGRIFGQTYDITINGYAYTLTTLDHSLPVNGEATMDSSGLFNGGGYTRGQERISVEINAATGTPAPAQLVPFAATLHGFSSKRWIVGSLQIRSSQTGLRTYSAELLQYYASL